MAEFAVGRRMSAWLRIGIEAQYRWDMEYRGNANFLSVGVNQPVSAQARSLATMATVYWDINSHGLFQPYIGAGAGLAVNHVDKMTYRFPDNTGRHKISVMPSGDRQDAAFMVTGGTGVVLSDSVILDIAYRYQDLGRIGTDRGSMVMDILPEGIEVDETSAPLRTHGITAACASGFNPFHSVAGFFVRLEQTALKCYREMRCRSIFYRGWEIPQITAPHLFIKSFCMGIR